MIDRRRFLLSGLSAAMGLSLPDRTYSRKRITPLRRSPAEPLFVSTWNHGLPANIAAMERLRDGGDILDAVEAGVMVSEADPEVGSVGLGGMPDSSGRVTLDACIMDPEGNAGSVACLEEILHPVSVARKVMEKTVHVMLVGKGAQQFALSQGFTKQNLLTGKARAEWKKALKEGRERAGHDTIGLIGMDTVGRPAGACTTSGMGMKLPGRVGDSPIIGAGLYVDSEGGAAAATGTGELVMKTLGSFLIVELMRNGLSPEQACREALQRIMKKYTLEPEHQVGFICFNTTGEVAGCSLRKGFEYAVYQGGDNRLVKAPYLI